MIDVKKNGVGKMLMVCQNDRWRDFIPVKSCCALAPPSTAPPSELPPLSCWDLTPTHHTLSHTSLFFPLYPVHSQIRAYPPATDKKVIKLLNGTSVSPFPISAIHSGFGSLKIALCCFMKQKKQASEHLQAPSWSPGPHSAVEEGKISNTLRLLNGSYPAFPLPYPLLNGR